MKIVLAGPPRSGKSCLREGLKQAIRAIPGVPYPYVITACPDGEGSWFQETVNADPARAAECKAAYKAKFTPEFVERIKTSVKMCSLELVLVDIGGIPSVENEQICSGATHMVILAGDMARTPEWHGFAKKVGLVVVAEIFSDYHGRKDEVIGVADDGILRGNVHHLERGEKVSERPMIRALAEFLVKKAAQTPQPLN
jgi:CRISPR-associated protein Csx3